MLLNKRADSNDGVGTKEDYPKLMRAVARTLLSRRPTRHNMRKRLLFVDDDREILELFNCLFEALADQWEARCAATSAQALAYLAAERFDVIISDMRMPGMSGAQLLGEVAERYPACARILLSGYADQEEAASVLQNVHQYLLKPCDLQTLRSTLDRVCALSDLLRSETLKALIGRMNVVPSLPCLYFQIIKELQSSDASIERIAEIISRDVGMTAKLLQMVNSAFFGLRRRISSAADAVQVLGVDRIRSLSLGLHAFSCFSCSTFAGFSFDQFWKHSLQTAMLAKQIIEIETNDRAMAEEAFNAGMLHDLGKLALLSNFPAESRRLLNENAASTKSLGEAEEKTFGSSHAEIGAYLLGLWGLPSSIIEAVAFHHVPSRAAVWNLSALTAVHLADHLTDTPAVGKRIADDGMDEAYLTHLGFNKRIEFWRTKARATSKG